MAYREEALEAVAASKAIYAVADSEGRGLTSSEARAVESTSRTLSVTRPLIRSIS
jgi:hypothetical protein